MTQTIQPDSCHLDIHGNLVVTNRKLAGTLYMHHGYTGSGSVATTLVVMSYEVETSYFLA